MSASEAVNSATTPSTAGTVSGVKSANSLQTSNQSPQVSSKFRYVLKLLILPGSIWLELN